MLMQTPKCVYQHQLLYRHSNKDTPKRPIKRQHECMPQPRSKRIHHREVLEIPPYDTEIVPQGHHGYYPSPFAHIRFHGSAEYRSQSLERQQSYHDYYDPREPQQFQRQYSPSHGYSPYHGNRDYREPPQSYRHHSPSHEDPANTRTMAATAFLLKQQEQARRSNPPVSHNDKEFRRSHPPPPPPPNNDNPAPQTQEYQHRAIESEKRDLERNMDRVIKVYATKDDKYSGEKDDFFRPKLMTFMEHFKENPDKTLEQNFLLLVKKLEKLFEGLYFPNQRDTTLRNKLKKSMASSRISPVTQLRPPSTYEAMLAEYTNCFQVKA
ncbi:hypothetical protein E4U24_000375, partial [Claviceps purpurea]